MTNPWLQEAVVDTALLLPRDMSLSKGFCIEVEQPVVALDLGRRNRSRQGFGKIVHAPAIAPRKHKGWHRLPLLER
jgi:hypothetical protein